MKKIYRISKKSLSCLAICSVLLHESAFASIDISTTVSSPQFFTSSSETLSILTGGNLTVDTLANAAPAVSSSNFTDLAISVNSGDAAKGIIASGGFFPAVDISSSAALSSITLTSGIITSDAPVSSGGTINLLGAGGTTSIGLASGTTLSNTATSGIAINSDTSFNTALSITNAGTISAANHANSIAINLADSDGGSSLSLTNTGSITAGSSGTAIKINGTNSANITNSGSGTITGKVVLGSNASTRLAVNGGSITGDITLGNAAQILTLGGGVVNGKIDGAGQVSATSSTVLNGNIGSTSAITSLAIGSSVTLNAATNNNSINAGSVGIASGGVLTLGTGAFTAAVDGTSANVGTVNLNSTRTLASGTTLGGTNGLLAINIANGATITANESMKASTVTIGTGTSGALNLAAGKIITGNITLNANSTLTLNHNSSVTGNISQVTLNTVGSLVVSASSSVVLNGNVGYDSGSSVTGINSITLSAGSTLDAGTNNVTVKGATTNIGSGALLILGSQTLNSNNPFGTIQGTTNGVGKVLLAESLTALAFGSNTNALQEVQIAAGKTGTTIFNSIYATNVLLNSGSVLNISNAGSVFGKINGTSAGVGTLNFKNTSNSLTSGRSIGNDFALDTVNIANGTSINTLNDIIRATQINIGAGSSGSVTVSAGGSLSTTNSVFIANGASLTLNAGSVIGAINGKNNGEGSLIINTNFVSQGNIGSANKLATVQVNANSSLNLSANNNSLNATSISLGSSSSLTFGSGNLSGSVTTTSNNVGTINFNGTTTIATGSVLGSSSSNTINAINVGNSGNVTSNGSLRTTTLTIGGGTSGSFSLGDSQTITGNVSIASGASLTMGNLSAVTGTINGASSGVGTLNIGANASVVTQSSVGGTNPLLLISLASGSSLNAATNNNTLSATTLSLAGTSTLTLGTGAVTGTTRGATDGVGAVAFNGNNTLAGHMGTADNSLASITVAANRTLANGTFNLDATDIILNSGSVLNLGAGTVTGTIDGSSAVAGVGTVNVNASNSFGSRIGATNGIAALNIADGVLLTAFDSIKATTTTIGGGTSGGLLLASEKAITGNVVIANGGNLTLGNLSSVSGTINGGSSGVGDLNIATGAAVVTQSNIGSTALNSISLAANASLNAATNNNSIGATTVSLASGSTLTLGTGSVTGTVRGSSDGVGNVTISGNNTLAGNLGTSSNSLALVTVAAGKTLTAGSNNIDVTDIKLNAASVLSLGSGSILATVDGTAESTGVVNFTASNTISSGTFIGSTNGLAEINISNGALVNAGESLKAATVTIGGGTSGALSLAASKSITGNVLINDGAILTVGSGSSVTGTIDGATTGEIGTLNIASNSDFITQSNIGSTNKLELISLSSGSHLDAATHNNSLGATTITIDSDALLTLGTATANAAIEGASDGVGSVVFSENNTLGGNVGTASKSLAGITIEANKTVDAASYSLDASLITLRSSATLTLGTGTITGDLSLGVNAVVNASPNNTTIGATVLDDGATLTLGTAAATGVIRGASDGVGNVIFSANNTLAANVGTPTGSLATATIAANKIVDIGANNLDATNITLNNGSSINVGAGSIIGTVDGFTASKGTINFSADNTIVAGTLLGSTNGIAAINIANAADITANDSIKAATVTIGGGISGSLSLAASKTITGKVVIANGANLDLADSSSVAGNVEGLTDGVGTLNLNGNITLGGNVGSTSKSLLALTIGGGKTVIAGSNNIDATTISVAAGGTLELGSGTVNGTIQGVSDGKGNLTVTQNFISNNDIGTADNSLALVSVAAGRTLNLATNNNSLDATAISLASTSAIDVGSGTITGVVDGATSSSGTVNLNASNTISSGTLLGSSNGLLAINIANAVLINAEDSMKATTVTVGGGISGALSLADNKTITGKTVLSSGSTFTLGTSASVTNGIEGASDGVGSLVISGNTTLASSAGTSSKSLAAITIAAGKTLNTSTYNLDATNITLNSLSVLNVGSGTVTGVIDGFSAGVGTVDFNTSIITNDGTLIGSSNGLAAINIHDGASLTSSDSIKATTVTIGDGVSGILLLAGEKNITGNVVIDDGGNLTIGNNSAVLGTISGASSGVGSFNIATNSSVQTHGNISDLESISLAAGAQLDAATNNNSIAATAISLADGSSLTLGTGTITGEIDGGSAFAGTVNLEGDNTIAVGTLLGSTNGLAAINIRNGTEINANASMKATTVTVGGGTSGALTLADSRVIIGDVAVANGATLTLEDSASVIGTTKGASDGVGSVFLNGSHTLAGDLGTSANSLSSIEVAASGELTNGAYNLDATNIKLNASSILNLGSGSIKGTLDGTSAGVGTLNLTTSNTIDAMLGSSNGLAAINIADGAIITANNSIKASSLTIGGGSLASLTLSDNKSITGSTTISDAASLNLGNNTTINGAINGDNSSGSGSLVVSGFATVNGAIGDTYKLTEISIDSGAKLTAGGDIHADNILLSGILDLGNTSRSVVANVSGFGSGTLNLGQGAHTISGDLNLAANDILQVEVMSSLNAGSLVTTGATTIDTNTKLAVVVGGGVSVASGSRYNILSGGTGSSIVKIEDGKINVNSTGGNQFGLVSFSTLNEGDDLILLATSSIAESLETSDISARNAFNAINAATSTSGTLLAVQTFLNDSNNSSAEKEAVAKSVTPQSDNSYHKSAFSIANTSFEMVEKRLDTMRSGVSSGDAASQKGMWIQAFGGTASQDSSAQADGYHSQSQGFAIGADHEFLYYGRAGVSFTQANTRVKSNIGLKHTNIQTSQFNIYASSDCIDSYMNVLAGVAFNDYDSNRSIPVVSKLASANYSGKTYMAKVEAGLREHYKNGFIFTPKISFTAARNQVNGYQENGAGTLNLAVKTNKADFFEGRIGSKLEYNFINRKGLRFNPEATISYGYDFVGARQVSTNNFVGQNTIFTAQGSNIYRGSFKAGLGLNVHSADAISLNLAYEMEQKVNYQSHSGNIRLRYDF